MELINKSSTKAFLEHQRLKEAHQFLDQFLLEQVTDAPLYTQK